MPACQPVCSAEVIFLRNRLFCKFLFTGDRSLYSGQRVALLYFLHFHFATVFASRLKFVCRQARQRWYAGCPHKAVLFSFLFGAGCFMEFRLADMFPRQADTAMSLLCLTGIFMASGQAGRPVYCAVAAGVFNGLLLKQTHIQKRRLNTPVCSTPGLECRERPAGKGKAGLSWHKACRWQL